MRRLTTLVMVLVMLGGVAGCGGSESYRAAMTGWESCMAQAPVGGQEPAACEHLAADACQAVKREHLKGTGTGLSCYAVEGKSVVTASQQRSALSRCVAKWNETAGRGDLASVGTQVYRSHLATVAVYEGQETVYASQFGTGLTDKTADIAVDPNACIVVAYATVYVQQRDGSWLEAQASGTKRDAPFEPSWSEENANTRAEPIEPISKTGGGKLTAIAGGQAVALSAEGLDGRHYVEALEDEQTHHAEPKPRAVECSECQPSPSETQTLPRPVGYTPERFEKEKATHAEAKQKEREEQEANEAQTESELNRICSEGEAGNARCTQGIEDCEHSRACSKKYGFKYQPGRKESPYPAHW